MLHVGESRAGARLGAAYAPAGVALVSPMAVLIGAVWLGERIPPVAWCGGALAIAGVALVQLKAHR